MKRWLLFLFTYGMAVFIGYAIGRGTADQREYEAWKSNQQLHAVTVDCYDSNGNLVADPFAKLGGVTTGCAPGQTAKLRQPPSVR